MAGIDSRIRIFFEGVDEVSGTVDGIGNKISGFGTGLEDAFSPFADAAEKAIALSAAVAGVGAAVLYMRDDFRGAQARINASLQGTQEELDALGDVAIRVFTANFADSIGEAADGVAQVQKRFKDLELSLSDIEFATTSAFSLKDLFGADIEQVLGASRSLMEEFGLSVQESFDFLSTGFRDGLDTSGDFLETITEYSVQFSSGGANAEQFFSVMKTGLQDGINGTDRAADAFKEFRVRIQDGSDTTKDALEAIGINAEELGKKMANSSVTAVEAFQKVIERLRETDDSSVQLQAGVGLLGTQFEDLGTAGALAIDTTKTKMDELAGATEETKKQYETLGNAITGAFRTALAEIAKDDTLESLESQFVSFFENLTEQIPKVMEKLDFTGVVGSVEGLIGKIGDLFGDIDFSDADDIANAVQGIIDAVESLIDVTGGIAEAWQPVFDAFAGALRWFNDLDEGSKEFIGNFLGFSQQVVILGGALAGIGAAVSGASVAFSAAVPIMTGAASAIGVLVSPATGFAALAGAAGVAAGTLINDYVPGVDKAAEGVIAWADGLLNFSGTQGKANESTEEFTKNLRAEIEEMKKAREETEKIDDAFSGFFDDLAAPAQVEPIKLGIDLAGFQKDLDGFKSMYGYALQDVNIDENGEYVIELKPGVDQNRWGEMTGIIEEILPDGTRSFTYLPELDEQAARNVKKEIDEAIPPEKLIEIETDLQIAEIEAQAKQVEAALQYKAEVDVAEIEAAAEIITTLAQGAADAFSSTGEIIRDSLGLLAGLGDSLEDTRTRWTIEEQLEKENELRERSLKIQEELTEAQIDYMEARTERLERGDAMITVNADGLEPHLEGMVRSFVEFVQIEANAEGVEFLLGI